MTRGVLIWIWLLPKRSHGQWVYLSVSTS